ncbi:hypothetical protein [Glutamicibacter sp. MCAF14]|uniref:hypothetical protein n=1 Tax=Glutamicibacter sp. MCAF14 TaxID=3233043 RepID=UPI003F93D7BA
MSGAEPAQSAFQDWSAIERSRHFRRLPSEVWHLLFLAKKHYAGAVLALPSERGRVEAVAILIEAGLPLELVDHFKGAPGRCMRQSDFGQLSAAATTHENSDFAVQASAMPAGIP